MKLVKGSCIMTALLHKEVVIRWAGARCQESICVELLHRLLEGLVPVLGKQTGVSTLCNVKLRLTF